MKSDRKARGGRRSLRWFWSRTTVIYVALLVAVTVIAVAASEHQETRFAVTMSELEQETEASAVLERAVLEAAGMMLPVIYPNGDEAATEAALAEYREVVAQVDAAFERTHDALHTDAERATLDAARLEWTAASTAVQSAPSDYTPAEIFAGVTAGEDPFVETVWAPHDRLDRHLADLGFRMVEDMGVQAGEARDIQRVAIPVLLGVLAAGLCLAFLGARQVRRRVLEPLEEIGRAAHSLSERHTVPKVDVPHAVTEVREVARTLSETAMTLDLTHGLLEEQALTDVLTALPNRKAFFDRIGVMLDDDADGRVAVLFIDLDDFKDVNDTMGHAVGDELLQVVGRRLQAATRGCEMVARLGGDEFAVALDVGDDNDSAIVVAQRILDSVDEPMRLDGGLTKVGCSIGIAVAASDATADDVPELLANADFAMYMAKSQGKQRYELHSPRMHVEMVARMERRRELAEALDRNEFELHYQPVLDLDSGKVLGFEALVRWNHPTDGLLLPSEFIGIAEEMGIVADVGAWVLETACAHLAELHRGDPELMMSINVSPQQLTGRDFTRTVLNAVLGNRIVPDRLVLEITESMVLADSGRSGLDDLRAHGVHIALDDFGTGFSSLSQLKDLPADIVKIDRSFVSGQADHERSMLESIITLAQQLGLHVIAEGIEEPQDLDRLRAYRRVAGQGFLLARPMSAADSVGFTGAAALLGVGGGDPEAPR